MTDRPVLITDAHPSADDELARRQKRYAITMLSRIPFLVGAGILGAYDQPVLAIVCILISVPLPWIAVLAANDGPRKNPRGRKILPGTLTPDRALPTSYHVIDDDEPAQRTGAADNTDQPGRTPQ